MNYLASTVAGLLVLTATSTWAEPPTEMPNEYLDTMAAKLMMEGFQDVHVVDLEGNKLAAYDQWGSEVVIVVHPENRKIVNANFVHEADY